MILRVRVCVRAAETGFNHSEGARETRAEKWMPNTLQNRLLLNYLLHRPVEKIEQKK